MKRRLIDPRDPTRGWEIELDGNDIIAMREKVSMREKVANWLLDNDGKGMTFMQAADQIHNLYMDWIREEVEKLEPVDYGVYCYTRDAVGAQLAHDKQTLLEKCK